ncbi:MAG: biosynthetic-type acetolactate synthase large subunit [Planctomycetota bacterium]|nr:biosynthetic-type acetolactate synthase large subunit [Planctomycetota bacterium]
MATEPAREQKNSSNGDVYELRSKDTGGDAAGGELEGSVKGADIVVTTMEHLNVEHIFGYSGGAILEVYDELFKEHRKKIKLLKPAHEQHAGHAAQGYSRVTGKPGVVLVTSGPGVTNIITAAADAKLDSGGIVILAGQVPTYFMGTDAFQETDAVGTSFPHVKHSYQVMEPEGLVSALKEAFHLAGTGRKGPVLVDLPKDVQQMKTIPNYDTEVNLPQYNASPRPSLARLEEAADAINAAKRPLLYVGGGVTESDASDDLRALVEKAQIPVTTTILGLGTFPHPHPLSTHFLGMHGSYGGNYAADRCDLLIAVGSRFDDRVTGKKDEFAKGAKIIHIDIDPAEIDKNKKADIPIISDAKTALVELLPLVKEREHPEWLKELQDIQEKYPTTFKDCDDAIMPQHAIELLHQITEGKAIITTGVGQHQMWSAQYYHLDRPRRFVTSGGLGTMGFGAPAAIGAQVGKPNDLVVDIDGDRSFNMTLGAMEMATAYDLPVKFFILNNEADGMVVQWQDKFYGGLYAASKSRSPDFVKIADGYGVKGKQVTRKADLAAAIEEMVTYKHAYLLDIRVPSTEVYPMIPSNKTFNDIIVDPAVFN